MSFMFLNGRIRNYPTDFQSDFSMISIAPLYPSALTLSSGFVTVHKVPKPTIPNDDKPLTDENDEELINQDPYNIVSNTSVARRVISSTPSSFYNLHEVHLLFTARTSHHISDSSSSNHSHSLSTQHSVKSKPKYKHEIVDHCWAIIKFEDFEEPQQYHDRESSEHVPTIKKEHAHYLVLAVLSYRYNTQGSKDGIEDVSGLGAGNAEKILSLFWRNHDNDDIGNEDSRHDSVDNAKQTFPYSQSIELNGVHASSIVMGGHLLGIGSSSGLYLVNVVQLIRYCSIGYDSESSNKTENIHSVCVRNEKIILSAASNSFQYAVDEKSSRGSEENDILSDNTSTIPQLENAVIKVLKSHVIHTMNLSYSFLAVASCDRVGLWYIGDILKENNHRSSDGNHNSTTSQDERASRKTPSFVALWSTKIPNCPGKITCIQFCHDTEDHTVKESDAETVSDDTGDCKWQQEHRARDISIIAVSSWDGSAFLFRRKNHNHNDWQRVIENKISTDEENKQAIGTRSKVVPPPWELPQVKTDEGFFPTFLTLMKNHENNHILMALSTPGSSSIRWYDVNEYKEVQDKKATVVKHSPGLSSINGNCASQEVNGMTSLPIYRKDGSKELSSYLVWIDSQDNVYEIVI